jgi:hypothetical protein
MKGIVLLTLQDHPDPPIVLISQIPNGKLGD